MACGKRQTPTAGEPSIFGLVATLVNTLPKWPPHATDYKRLQESKSLNQMQHAMQQDMCSKW